MLARMVPKLPQPQMTVRYLVVGSYRSQKSRIKRYSHKREEAYEKQAKFWAKLERNDKWINTIAKFDKDRSGNLDAKELSRIIKEFGMGYWDHDGKYHPPDPKEKEVAWIMKATDHDSLGMDIGKVKFALDLWHAYENSRIDLDNCFEKFDVDKSGRLDKKELSKLLTTLNDGHAPTDEEIELLLSLEHDERDKSWLRLAVALWYVHEEEHLKMARSRGGCAIM